jgi:hypothetical protein
LEIGFAIATLDEHPAKKSLFDPTNPRYDQLKHLGSIHPGMRAFV